MLTLKKFMLVAACVACALGASTSAEPPQRHLRSAGTERATTEGFSLLANDEDADEHATEDSEESAIESAMEDFPLVIESNKSEWQDEPSATFAEGDDEDNQEADEEDQSPGTDDDDDEQSPGTDDDDDESVDELTISMERTNDTTDSEEVDTAAYYDSHEEDALEDSVEDEDAQERGDSEEDDEGAEDAADDVETQYGDEEEDNASDVNIEIEIDDANY